MGSESTINVTHIASCTEKVNGLIWVDTVCSDLFVRIFAVMNDHDLIRDYSVI